MGHILRFQVGLSYTPTRARSLSAHTVDPMDRRRL